MSDTAGSRSDRFVDQLLLEAGLDDDGQLRPALLQLRALGTGTPEPSAKVAALLARAKQAPAFPDVTAAATGEAPAADTVVSAPVDELAARRRAKRRVALTALSVAVSLSAGGAVAVASDQGLRDSFTQFNRAITSFVTGSSPAPAEDRAEEPLLPAPSGPAAPGVVPTDPAGAAQPGQVPPSAVPATPAETAKEATGTPAAPGKPEELPVVKDLPTAVPKDLTNGVGQQPQVPVPGPSDLPLPETLPAVPLR
ncbi:hypothetical protein FDW83_09925 [Pseudarthrobacter sp. NamE2]|uniref:hypothetical protein n=1 Tax=Pseudarthrobacter sp. NamE2 TaxID=2576838 RepID=UPI0010FF3107|nr:hypothetical protein [Pseudarthrobacter sp. NamE2]TLM83282.1 hypothetical protein FDW83_09925 [Pseudarthrobacter sp. NamE2]